MTNPLLEKSWNFDSPEISRDHFGDGYAMARDVNADVFVLWPVDRPMRAVAGRISTGISVDDPDWYQFAQNVATGLGSET